MMNMDTKRFTIPVLVFFLNYFIFYFAVVCKLEKHSKEVHTA